MLITLNPANNQWHAIMQITTSPQHSSTPKPGDIFPFSSVLCCRDISLSILTLFTVWEWTVLTVFPNKKLVFSRTVIHKVILRWYKYLNGDKETCHHHHPSLLRAICGFKLIQYGSPSPIISNSTFIFVTIPSATCIRSNPLAQSYFTYTGLSTCWLNIFPVNLPFWLK